jgi:hypothetical protein
MELKEMITIILSILIPIISGLGWIVIQLFKMQKEISNIKIESINIKVEILKEIRGLDSRLSHLEGYLIGWGQKTGTEERK